MADRKQHFSIDRPRLNETGFLAAYFPVNDPLVPIDVLPAYESAFVDVIELGIRTDNPYADGDIVASSMERSTGLGTIEEAASAVDRIRAFKHDTMGMIFAYAEDKLARSCSSWKNIDALLCLGKAGPTADRLSAEAARQGARVTKFVPYDLPVTAVAAARQATGFVMLQYTSGKTGIRSGLDERLGKRVATLRREGVNAHILTGIGVSDTLQADHAMQSGADGVVVGSRAIEKAIEGRDVLEDYLCEIKEALDG